MSVPLPLFLTPVGDRFIRVRNGEHHREGPDVLCERGFTEIRMAILGRVFLAIILSGASLPHKGASCSLLALVSSLLARSYAA